ncbi:phospholipid carrier-dependent glycosyltransferase [Anaerobacillus alkaliphilus]|uniref:Phospholipid carrier-dependent glycosyltransferase n=1 Tax=Anaerobacillus alkaliphilus TaxID=1548597 RepID=A0A4Q0VW79_9BACI|nr:glycosyltransferase family 39 protein [Anaerobacillus alkaliphilus]RXJ02943.1 phospholipid carrier-dependent glycosyltransferase [Anaerobacillus alkaliphilus]
MVGISAQKKLTYITVFVFILLFILRLPYIDNPPFERYEMWRQSDTESMARNFLDGKFNIFYPQLNYDGPAPNYVQLEFQLVTFIIAILYKFFGYHYEIARFVPVLFFMGSAVYLYLIAKRYYGQLAAIMATFLYGVYPLNLYFSRAVMPETAALFFYIGAFYYFDSWIRKSKNSSIIAAALFTALAISLKVPAVFVGIPMLVMAVVKYKEKVFKVWQLYFFAVVSLLPPFAYFKWLETISTKAFVSGIASKHIIPKAGFAIFTEEAQRFFTTKMPESLTWVGITLFFVGLFVIKWKREYPIGVWAIAMIIEVLLIVSIIRFNYYLVFITPLMAILSAKVLVSISNKKVGMVTVAVFLLLFGSWNYYQVLPRFELNDNVLGQAEVVKTLTDKDDLIIIATLGPELLNASERKGWRFHLPSDRKDFETWKLRLEILTGKGAKYFVPAGGYIYADEGARFKTYLEENFETIEAGKFTFYKLQ